MTDNALLRAIEAACAVFARNRISYALIGGAAMPAWGRARATADADMLLHIEIGTVSGDESVSTLINAFREAGFAHLENADRRRLEDNWVLHLWYPIRDRGLSIRVDLILSGSPHTREILSRASPRRINGQEIQIASCEDLVLLKLAAGRPIDLADATELIAINADTLDDDYLTSRADAMGLRELLEETRAKARPEG